MFQGQMKVAHDALALSFHSLGPPDSIEAARQRGRILLHATHALYELIAPQSDPAKGEQSYYSVRAAAELKLSRSKGRQQGGT